MSKLSQIASNLEQESSEHRETIEKIWTETFKQLEQTLLSELNTNLNSWKNDTNEMYQAFQDNQRERLKSDLNHYEQNLKDIQAVRVKIQMENSEAEKAFRRNWWKPVIVTTLGIMLAVSIILLVVWIFMIEIERGLETIESQNQTIETLSKEGGNWKLNQCGEKGKTQACVKVKADHLRYGDEQGEYWLIPAN